MPIRLALVTTVAAIALAGAAQAAYAAAPPIQTATGTEGASADEVVVTAERNIAAAAAPSKATLDETQPQSIITRRYIEQATPETGDFTTTVLIAPSVSGVSSNGGGVGDTNTTTLRGFQDGQFNITYDGIAFGDANDTTHHPAAFFPGSIIGAAVVDRGPGAAGDLGQANFGGAIHLFSPTVSDTAGASQKLTFGSFNTQSYVTTLQSGPVSWLHDTKVLLNFDERTSDSELSYASGEGYDQTFKSVTPITDKLSLTLFGSYNYILYHQPDTGAGMGMGVTAGQLAAYGKNFALNANPNDEHYYGFNYQMKHSYFTYADLKWDAGQGLTVEDQPYDYFYSNKTVSAAAVNDLVGVVPSPSSAPTSAVSPGVDDIGGYHKLNRYQTMGDILRVNKDFGFGALRAGGLVEWSWAERFIENYDLTTGQPDTGNPGGAAGNISYFEPSRWFQYQLFADFEWRPIDRLTITPGIKFIDYKRTIDATVETDGLPAKGSREYEKTPYFLTVNYKILPNWSVYGQTASGFLVPPVKTLTPAHGTTASTQPEETATYQLGTVYQLHRLTFDADIYKIHATNVLVNQSGTSCQCYVNAGTGDYAGFEAQGAYTFDLGLTLFANGSVNTAKNTKTGSGPGTIFSNAPKGTAALGVIYQNGPWMGTLSAKDVGSQLGSDGATYIPSYTTVDASITYDFGRFKLKLAVFNLADQRALTDFDGTYSVFQVGRQIQGTLQAKF